MRQAAAVLESITAHEDIVSVQLRGHPWVTGEYWPMIAPCFQVRAVDDAGGEHDGVLWEAAWAEVDIPGRSA